MKPTTIFLDTSIFTGQQFNFSSVAFTTFIEKCKKSNLQLVLPDPTEREIKRQIKDRSQEALEALESARRKAPFLAKWKSFPAPQHERITNWEVTRLAAQEWNSFLMQFEVIKLKYGELNVGEIMNWYDAVLPPFDKGKKRKEFPDAFAIALLDAYANKNEKYIAVVSSDHDFKAACVRFPKLMYFDSLPRLTEFLISEENNLDRFRNSIQDGIELLSESIDRLAADLSYYHSNGELEFYDLDLQPCIVEKFNIVAIGNHECTVTFEALLSAEVEFEWQGWWDRDDEGPERMRGWVSDESIISGSAKLIFDSQTGELTKVGFVDLDDGEIEVNGEPFEY